ncbi:MAG TPA: helix-turn-helix domain-containing protein [Blastocatellia bacterium]|jgi:excisionase family DNA binding protein|nr:helix-turn-helix domain-containing protein [Blastocatellia bacterium]
MTLLTTKQVAERLGVTTKRIQAMIRDGRLPAEKFGRDYLIKESDLKLVEDRKPGRPSKQAKKRREGIKPGLA